jgi:hypothetical protein
MEINMPKFDEALSESFDLIPVKTNDVVLYDDKKQIPDSIEEDIESVRENLYNLLEKGENALEDLSEIAKAEESPRAFEVLNSMLNTMSDISMKIIEIEERKAKIKKMNAEVNKGDSESSPTTVNNNSVVFVGTTQELQEQIKNRLSGK